MALKRGYPSAKEYVAYFLKHQPTLSEKKMLCVNYLAPQKTITAPQLSYLMGWRPTASAANSHYGKYAKKVAKRMGFIVPYTYLEFFVDMNKLTEGKNKGWNWKMRNNLAIAIKQMGWGTDKRFEDADADLGFDLLTTETEFKGNNKKVSEGRRKLRSHYVRERNPRVIKDAKKLALHKHKELRCEVCNFSFKEVYGDRVADYIEGHHKLSVSKMKRGDKTSAKDIALLCSNCHRTIHAKDPHISVEELNKLYKRRRQ